MRWILTLCLLLILAVPAQGAFLIVSADHPDTMQVDLPGYTEMISTHTTISAALLATSDNDTVYVRAGTYNEKVVPTAWAANGVTLIGPRSLNAEMRSSNTAMTLAVGSPSVRDCKVKWMRLDGDAGSYGGFLLSGSQYATIDSCVTEGDFRIMVGHCIGTYTTGYGANVATVSACSLSASRATGDATYMPIDIRASGVAAPADSLTIRDCDIELADHTTTLNAARFLGVTNLVWSNNRMVLPVHTSAGAVGLAVYSLADSTEFADGVIIEDSEIIAQDCTNDLVALSIGKVAAADGIVDNVTIRRNYIWVPPLTDMFCIKAEADYDGTAGEDNTHSDNIYIYDNVVVNGRVGIGLHENVRWGVVARNLILGPEPAATWLNIGLVIEDARHVVFADNVVQFYQRGISFSHSGSPTEGGETPDFRNYDMRVVGNDFLDCDYAMWQQVDENYTCVVDSMLLSVDNLAIRCGAWGYIDDGSTNEITLDQWRALTIPALTGWEHAVGDEEYENYPAELRRARALPMGTFRHIGGLGVRRD